MRLFTGGRQFKNIAKEVIKIYTNWGIEKPGIEETWSEIDRELRAPAIGQKPQYKRGVPEFLQVFFGRRLNVIFPLSRHCFIFWQPFDGLQG